jgi:hypothetical protein
MVSDGSRLVESAMDSTSSASIIDGSTMPQMSSRIVVTGAVRRNDLAIAVALAAQRVDGAPGCWRTLPAAGMGCAPVGNDLACRCW